MENHPKPHALCLPFPLQSHIKAMLKLSKLLHNKGFQITFVNTEFNQKRFLKNSTTLDHDSLEALGFRFVTVPDGLPPSDPDASQNIPALCQSTRTNFSGPLFDLVKRINDNTKVSQNGVVSDPPVSCLIVDGSMSLAVGSIAGELQIPLVKFFPISASALVGFQQFRALLEKGIIPIRDDSSLTNELENTVLDWVPGMTGLRLRDLPSSWRITGSNKIGLINFSIDVIETAHESSAVIVQTFDAIERDALEAFSAKIPHLYTIGPLELLLKNRLEKDPLEAICYSLWEEVECLEWLNRQEPDSVIYVNFGSVMVLTPQQLVDIGWGLACSNQRFLWVIRPDLVVGESACLSKEFLDETSERGLIISWCPQEDVLSHSSVGGFLTHCGWNSVIESVSSGVPLLCYPFGGDQQTNCWLACNGLGIGIEIDKDVKRDQVEELVRDLIIGEKGKEMRNKALEWKKLAHEATSPNGTSSKNLDNLVEQVLLKNLSKNAS